MTEAEWLASTDSLEMLRSLSGKASDRKLRLFAVACGRRIGDELIHPDSRRAVEVAQRFADGQATATELHDAQHLARAVRVVPRLAPGESENSVKARLVCAARVLAAAVATCLGIASVAARRVLEDVLDVACRQVLLRIDLGQSAAECFEVVRPLADVLNSRANEEQVALSDLLREVFGPRAAVKVNRSWLSWNDGTVVRLARAIYEERAYKRMSILADALEDAGCDNVDVLTHCRGNGHHVRGCWVLDLLLGRE